MLIFCFCFVLSGLCITYKSYTHTLPSLKQEHNSVRSVLFIGFTIPVYTLVCLVQLPICTFLSAETFNPATKLTVSYLHTKRTTCKCTLETYVTSNDTRSEIVNYNCFLVTFCFLYIYTE